MQCGSSRVIDHTKYKKFYIWHHFNDIENSELVCDL